MPEENKKKVLYHIVCASPPAQGVGDFIALAQGSGWDVCLIATLHATNFIDIPRLEELTGHPVRSEYKLIGTPDVFPKMDAMVVAPMTLNTTRRVRWPMGEQGHDSARVIGSNCGWCSACSIVSLHIPTSCCPSNRLDGC